MRMDYMMEKELEEYTHIAPTRFCRTDETGNLGNPGLYYPNYNILHSKRTNECKGINFRAPRPRNNRDDSFTDAVINLENYVLRKVSAVGIFYALTEAPDGSLLDCATSTYSLFLVRGKRIGITALHTIKGYPGERYFIDTTKDNWKDKSADLLGISSFDNFISDLVEVYIHKDSLVQRASYIHSLTPSDDGYKENLDPEFGQCFEPVLDLLFFEAPSELSSVPALTLANELPDPGDLTLLIAYHNTTDGRVDSLSTDREYQFTTTKPPDPDDVVYIHRSVGVGYGSCGGVYLNQNLEAFAIHLGAFYDNPGDATTAANPPRPAWTILHPTDPFRISIQLPEDVNNIIGRKNRNIAISVFHSGFMRMLEAIAP